MEIEKNEIYCLFGCACCLIYRTIYTGNGHIGKPNRFSISIFLKKIRSKKFIFEMDFQNWLIFANSPIRRRIGASTESRPFFSPETQTSLLSSSFFLRVQKGKSWKTIYRTIRFDLVAHLRTSIQWQGLAKWTCLHWSQRFVPRLSKR